MANVACNVSGLFEKISSKEFELNACRRILDKVDSSTNINAELKEKIEEIVYSSEVTSSLHVNPSNDNDSLLGLTLKTPQLSNDEKKKLMQIIRLDLPMERNVMDDKIITDFDLTQLHKEEVNLLKLKGKLNETQKRYYNNLLYRHNLLENVLKIKLEKSQELIAKKIEYSMLSTKVVQLKIELIKMQIAKEIFMEASEARQAYEKVFDEITKEQSNLNREIEILAELLNQYNLISCKSFSDILNSYKCFKMELEKKQTLWKEINSMEYNFK